MNPVQVSTTVIGDAAVDLPAAQAGIALFSPHDCRRTLAGDLLDSGVDLATVQAMLGHASPESTNLYMSADQDRLLECVLDVPEGARS